MEGQRRLHVPLLRSGPLRLPLGFILAALYLWLAPRYVTRQTLFTHNCLTAQDN